MKKIKKLHNLKVFVYKNLFDFRDIFSKIKDIDFQETLDMSTDIKHTYISDDELKNFIDTLEILDDIFDNYLGKFEDVVEKSNNWNIYTEKEKETVMITASIAKTVKKLCDTPIIDEDGEITQKSKKVLELASEFIDKLNKV